MTRFSRTTWRSIAVGCAATLVFAPVGPASGAAGDDVAAAADLIDELAPDIGEAVPVEDDAGELTVEADGLDVELPDAPDDSLVLDAGDVELEILLPEADDLEQAEATDDGTVVYGSEGDGADVAVQVFESQFVEGAITRIQTVVPDASQTQFTYEFDGDVTLTPREDGGAVISSTTDPTLYVGEVLEPWAVDASGATVPTRYEVDGASLTQIIELTDDTTFPVVADPSVIVKPFQQVTDSVHVSKSPPRTASVHGYWRDPYRSYVGRKAVVTVWLQMKVGSTWRTHGTAVRTVYAGGGAGKRATARKVCRGAEPRSWRSIVDVDVVNVLDSPNKFTSPAQTVRCSL